MHYPGTFANHLAGPEPLTVLHVQVRSDAIANGRIAMDGASTVGSSSHGCTDWRQPR